MAIGEDEKNKVCPVREANFTSHNGMYHCPVCGEMILGLVDTWDLCGERNQNPDFEVSPTSAEDDNAID